MHIAFVTNNYTPYSGGVVSSINATTAQLQKSGHTVTIITLDFLGKGHHDPGYVQRIICPIKFRYKNNYMAVPWRAYKQIFEHIVAIKPDIIHTHHPFLLGQAALYTARKLSLPIVFTYHTLYQEYAHYVPFPLFITKPIITKIVLSFCNAVNGIIAPSNTIQNYLFKNNVQQPIALISSGLQPIFLSQDNLVKKHNSNKPFQLLLVSRFAKEKNIHFALAMFSELQKKGKYHFKLVGYGSEWENIKYYTFEKLRLSPNAVQFIHKPTKQKLSQLYQQADLFVFPSQTDTQGLVLAEAMAGGTPVVALDGPGQRDIIKNEYNGFIVESGQEMCSKIVKIAQNKRLYRTLQKNALQTSQKYDPGYTVCQLINFYNQYL